MARTDLTAVRLTPNDAIAQPAGTAGNTDGHRVVCPNAWPADNSPEYLVLRVVVANATTTVTVKAGEDPPALEAQAVSKALPVGTHFVGPFTSGRVGQRDGTIHVDYSVAANVTVTALQFVDAT